jgi:hypothetical protein
MARRKPISPIPNSVFDDSIKEKQGIISSPPDTQKENRALEVRRDEDTQPEFKLGLQDIDEAVFYYFNQILKPSVKGSADERVSVPVIYGSPETWKAAQKDGYYRDKNSKIQTPLIMVKRLNVEKNRTLSNKMDANYPQVYQTFEKAYSKRNYYDKFSILNNTIPQKEFYTVVIPDYVNISYEALIWTDFVEQMNDLIEMINYASDSYWGDPDKFKFNTRIGAFGNTIDVPVNDNRIVRTSFNLSILGFLIPSNLAKSAAEQTGKYFSKSTIIVKENIVSNL